MRPSPRSAPPIPSAFLHCLQQEAEQRQAARSCLGDRLARGRWIPAEDHALTYIDPTDHLAVHQAWLQACHGPDRVARATVRTVQPLDGRDGLPPGPIGRYDLTLIDLVGTDGVDAVVVTLTPIDVDEHQVDVVEPPPRGALELPAPARRHRDRHRRHAQRRRPARPAARRPGGPPDRTG